MLRVKGLVAVAVDAANVRGYHQQFGAAAAATQWRHQGRRTTHETAPTLDGRGYNQRISQ
jgi:hypothetical protein